MILHVFLSTARKHAPAPDVLRRCENYYDLAMPLQVVTVPIITRQSTSKVIPGTSRRGPCSVEVAGSCAPRRPRSCALCPQLSRNGQAATWDEAFRKLGVSYSAFLWLNLGSIWSGVWRSRHPRRVTWARRVQATCSWRVGDCWGAAFFTREGRDLTQALRKP